MASLPPTPIRVACYARVSTEDQAERQTVQAQIDFDRRYCELHGLTIAGIYVDDGISGTLPLDERPDGRRLVEDAKAGAFTMVLVYRLDRLGRSLKSLLAAHEQLEEAGVAIRSGTEPFDTASPIGRFLFSLLASMAELERATITERFVRGRDRVACDGKYTGGPVPLGYDLDNAGRFVRSARIVPELNVSEAELVCDLFRRVANGETTLNAERNRLTALGVPRYQRYGGDKGKKLKRTNKWSLSTLSTIIHNPVYKGTGGVQSRYGTLERPTEPIVDAGTWERAQMALTRNRNLSKKNAKREYLLRGLVKCGHCGFTYTGATSGGAYRCNGAAGVSGVEGSSRCFAGAVNAKRLEEAVWCQVRGFIDHPDEYIAEAQQQLRERLADASQADEQRKRLARDLAGKEQERERVLDLFRRGRISPAECDRDLDKVAAESREIREMLDSFQARAEMAAASEAYLSDVGAALAEMHGKIHEIERTNDRAAMRELIELLAPRLILTTELVGQKRVRQQKRVTLHVTLAFANDSAVVSIMN